MSYPPIDTELVAGRWHRDQLRLRGIAMEVRILLKSLVASRDEQQRKFLIVGRARSGTTLLTRLLNSHQDIQCDGELLKTKVINPAALLNRAALKSTKSAYGAKFLSYQIVQVQKLRDPIGFFYRLEDLGFRFIHLERNTFFQTLSLTMARNRNVFHSDMNLKLHGKVYIDPDDFLKRIVWNERLLEFERECLDRFSPFSVRYEANLANEILQTELMKKLCDWLQVAYQSSSQSLKKVLPETADEIIENYDAVANTLSRNGYQRLLN